MADHSECMGWSWAEPRMSGMRLSMRSSPRASVHAPARSQSAVSVLGLITIPISHFGEKARWALELARLPYREERHLQVIHSAHAWRAGRGWTAPVLVTPEGPLRESAEIVRFADAHAGLGLYRRPLAAALEASFDHQLGPDARTWMYHRLLGHDELIRAYGAPGVPRWERAGMPVMLPLVKR